MKAKVKYLLIFYLIVLSQVQAQPWSCATYPDEAGFKQRMEGMLPKIAAKEFGQRSLAESKCTQFGWPARLFARRKSVGRRH